MQINQKTLTSLEIKAKGVNVNLDDKIKINDFVLPGPGEYEIAGAEIYSPTVGITVLKLEDISIAFLGGLNRALSDEEIGSLNDVSILITPILDVKVAQQIIKTLEPTIVIPFGEKIDEFCSAIGGCPAPVAGYKIVKSQLGIMEGQTIVLLNPEK